MKKIIKSNKGSSFIYVLIVLLILTILTASLITATVTNYQLGILKGGRNTSFYMNDGAIEEALAEVEELSHKAEVAASEVIQAEDPEFKMAPEWILFEKWLERKMKLDPEDDDYLTSEDASAYYEKALRKEFDKQFLLNLLGNSTVEDDDNYILINDDDEFVEGNNFTITQNGVDGLSDSVITNLEIVTFDPAGFTSFEDETKPTLSVESEYLSDTKEIEVTIQSDGTYSIYNKQIEVVLKMIPPTYQFSTVTTLKRQELYKNSILENALTATNDIVITGGEVESVGDIYAKGTFPEEKRIKSHEKGGIVVGYAQLEDDFLDTEVTIPLLVSDLATKGSLSVNGHIKTGSSVKLQNDDSSLKVFNESTSDTVQSNIHADSFIVMKDSENTSTEIDSHMLLLDDLFVNASNTSISIGEDASSQGFFMTFFDGNEITGVDSPINPDLSSSIRVNYYAANISIIANRLFIPGVAYIDIFRDTSDGRKYFQTGESMTTEHNFYFYQNQLSDQELRTKEFVFYDENGLDHTAYEYLNDEDEIEESVNFKVDHFITSVRDGIEAGNDEIVPLADKSIIQLRDLSTEEVLAQNYALGVFMSNGKIFNPAGIGISSAQFDSDYRLEFNETIDLRMNLLGMRNYIDSENIITVDKDDDTTASFMDTFVDYTKDASFTNISTDNRIIILNSDVDKDLYINYPSSFEVPAGAIIINNVNELSGLVATKGNIFIYNESLSTPLTISGTLISDQSIIFYGPGKKKITRSDEVVYGTISQYDDLVEAFHVREGRTLATQTRKDSSNNDVPTRSYTFDLDMEVLNVGAPVNVNILTNPQLDGSSKEESVKGYVIDYWKEF